jgi:hypothetical protein
VNVPGRLPDDLDVDVGDAGHPLHLAARVRLERIAHPTAGRRHRHLDLDPVATVFNLLILFEDQRPAERQISGMIFVHFEGGRTPECSISWSENLHERAAHKSQDRAC